MSEQDDPHDSVTPSITMQRMNDAAKPDESDSDGGVVIAVVMISAVFVVGVLIGAAIW